MYTQSDRERPPADALARALGWFSVALGSAEVLAPAQMARLIGAPGDDRTTTLVRAMGAREIAHGLAILSRPGSAGPVWSRVAGDAVDLAFLKSISTSEYADSRRLLAAGAAVLGVAVFDVIAAQRLSSDHGSAGETPSRFTRSVTINRPLEQVFAFWQQLENLPRFMRYLESVERLGDGRSRWKARAPGGVKLQWEAETVAERDGELIAWRSIPGSQIETSGNVRFGPAPGARGTEVHVDMEFRLPAGSLGRAVAWMLGRDPEGQLADDLRRFKQLLETGEIALSDGQGMWRPGRPSGNPEQTRTLAGVDA